MSQMLLLVPFTSSTWVLALLLLHTDSEYTHHIYYATHLLVLISITPDSSPNPRKQKEQNESAIK